MRDKGVRFPFQTVGQKEEQGYMPSSAMARALKPRIGKMDAHTVKKGKETLSIYGLTTRRSAVASYSRVTTIDRSAETARKNASRALHVLQKPGAFDAAAFLKELSSTWHYVGHLADLKIIAHSDQMRLSAQKAAVKSLSNVALAAVCRRFMSVEMDELQTAILRTSSLGDTHDEAHLACHAIEAISDLEGIVLKELSDRLAIAEHAGLTIAEFTEVIRNAPFAIMLNTGVLIDTILRHPDQPFEELFCLSETYWAPDDPLYLKRRRHVVNLHMSDVDNMRLFRNASGILRRNGNVSASPLGFGGSMVILRPEVRERMHFHAADLFYQPSVKVDATRRQAFYNLLDGSTLTPEFVVAKRLPGTPEHEALEAWFDELEKKPHVTMQDLRSLPEGIKLRRASDLQGLYSKLEAAFGVRDASQRKFATFENLETLFSGLTSFRGNALTLATIDSHEGRPNEAMIPGLNFITGEISGPIIPKRDIAQIRISLSSFSDKAAREAAMLRAEKLTEAIGIPVKFFDDTLTISQIRAGESFEVRTKSLPTMSLALENAVSNPAPIIQQWLQCHPKFVEGLDEACLDLTGPSVGKFSESLWKFAKARNLSRTDIVSSFMREEGANFLLQRLSLLHTLNGLTYENDAVRGAFEQCAITVGSLKGSFDAELPKLIVERAQRLAVFFRNFMANVETYQASPEKVFLEIAQRLRLIEAECQTILKRPDFSLASEPGRVTLNRICFNAANILALGTPAMDGKALQALFEAFNHTALAAPGAALNSIFRFAKRKGAALLARGETPEETVQLELDLKHLSTFLVFVEQFMLSLGRIAETRTMDAQSSSDRFTMARPMEFTFPFMFVPDVTRRILAGIAPTLARRFDRAFPGVTLFPKAAHPERFPKSDAERKRFLVQALDAYREVEASPDNRELQQGRGHVIRVAIFAKALSAIVAEKGLKPDLAAIALGVICHDAGRKTASVTRWAEQSATAACEMVCAAYGEDTMGEAWEKAFYNMIVEDLPGNTLESMILKAADRMDGARQGSFDPDEHPVFAQLRPYLLRVRRQLLLEASRLQRITNPYCANRNILKARRDAVINMTTSNPDSAVQRLESLETRIQTLFREEQALSNAELIDKFLNFLREMPEVFPLLNKYCLRTMMS